MSALKQLFLFLLVFLIPAFLSAEEKEKVMHTVTKVIDGMTLELDGKQIVRLIGVSTPNADSKEEAVQKWAEKAKEFSQKLVGGSQVWLEYGDKKTDDQGRTWAFVFFNMGLKKLSGIVDESFMPFWGTAGNFMLNRMLIEYGYATTTSPFSFKYRSTFMHLEKRARTKNIGMWQDFQY